MKQIPEILTWIGIVVAIAGITSVFYTWYQEDKNERRRRAGLADWWERN